MMRVVKMRTQALMERAASLPDCPRDQGEEKQEEGREEEESHLIIRGLNHGAWVWGDSRPGLHQNMVTQDESAAMRARRKGGGGCERRGLIAEGRAQREAGVRGGREGSVQCQQPLSLSLAAPSPMAARCCQMS